MELLMHNWIADMPGQQFIFVAVIYCMAIILGSKLCLFAIEPTRGETVPPMDSRVDPFEVAFLRGGPPEVLTTAIFSLIQKEYIIYSEGTWVNPSERADLSNLEPIERAVFEQIGTTQQITQIMLSGNFAKVLTRHCAGYEERLTRKKLLASGEWKQLCWLVVLIGLAMMDTLLLYKLMVAISKGKHNIGFLMALIVITPIIQVIFCKPSRITALGKQYLTKLQETFANLKEKVATDAKLDSQQLGLMVGLFGVTVLAGTSYGFFNDLVGRTSASTGSSCSSSSCSSGGGSCGGGGCGGCGGD